MSLTSYPGRVPTAIGLFITTSVLLSVMRVKVFVDYFEGFKIRFGDESFSLFRVSRQPHVHIPFGDLPSFFQRSRSKQINK